MASPLSSWFGDSPFKALAEHSAKVHQCVRLIRDLFDASLAGNREAVEKLAQDIFRLETEADQLRDQLHEKLNSQLLISISKAHIFGILEDQDSIADRAEDLAAVFTYRSLTLPDEIASSTGKFLDRVLADCRLAESIFSKLLLLVETSFRGRDAQILSELIFTLRKQEDETKAKKIDLLCKLHQSQASFSAVDLIAWTQIIERMGDISKFADNAATGISIVIRGN